MNNNTNVCFLANFSKTYFFHDIAQELAKDGIKAYWITTNRTIYEFLKEEYGEESVLLINRAQIAQAQKPVGEFKLNELLYGDRVLRHHMKDGLAFLQNIQQPVYDFLKKHKVQNVFGEITWAHEVLIHRMINKCKELRCSFLNPHVIRMPNSRFAFFTDERQSIFKELGKADQTFYPMLKIAKPDYLKINDKRLKQANSLTGRLDRIRRFFSNENIDSEDPTLLNDEFVRFKTRTKEEWNKETYKLINRISFEELQEKPYVFLGLHKQPEASVDVLGRYYEDQFLNICNVWRCLPEGWNLIVKEHTNAIGDRDVEFYKKLQQLPNVYFVDEKTDSYSLIENAKLVATITGTIAYEAALMQIPAITFAPVFFNRINYCRQVSLEVLSACKDLSEIVEQLLDQKDNRLEFSQYIMKHSFPGVFSDPISNPAILDEDNVAVVTKAFKKVIEAQKENAYALHK